MINFQYNKFIFLNNALGQFYRTFLNWLSDIFYTPINTKVIGTYTKAVHKLQQRLNEDKSFDVILPAVILDPSGDFRVDDRLNHLWRYDGIAPQIGKDLFDPIYEDGFIKMTPVYNRFVGEISIVFLLRSIYEYLDLRLYCIQSFSNENRYNRPFFVNTFLVLPSDIINYSTEVDGQEYKIDWTKALLEYKLIQNIAKNEYCIPLILTPMFKFTGISDASNRKSVGTDLEDYRLELTIEYEIDLPVYFVVESAYQIRLPATISIGNGFASTEIDLPKEYIIDDIQYMFRKAYYLDIENSDDLDNIKESGIHLPFDIDNQNCLKLIINGNILDYGSDYKFSDYTNKVIYFLDYKEKLKIGDHIEFAIYDIIGQN